jgi:hypothetical protein
MTATPMRQWRIGYGLLSRLAFDDQPQFRNRDVGSFRRWPTASSVSAEGYLPCGLCKGNDLRFINEEGA